MTKENKFPERGQFEAGVLGDYINYKEDFMVSLSKSYMAAPYVRYGVFENLALSAEVPYVNVKDRTDDREHGLGDINLGLEFRPWQDIFRYPWIVPHLTVGLPTGDEDKNLGRGKTSGTFGIAVGTVVEEVVHFIADARYGVVSGSETSDEDVASIAGAIVWDLSDQFSLIGEVKATNEDNAPYDGTPVYFDGGMSYEATKNLSLMFFAGSAQNTAEDFHGNMKVAYTF
ncbi:MAG: hypothetical protein A2X46_18255 [Lentisphaerae bacterium GWF2_57_35]|nr:MAG: hypothetical protein A2X46_18255 [Lentisphaerae bacterium GWF2_57_35]